MLRSVWCEALVVFLVLSPQSILKAEDLRKPAPDPWQKVAEVEQAIPSAMERVAYFSKILMQKDDPASRSLAWLGLGLAHETAGNLNEACTAYGHYTQLSPKDAKGWSKLAETGEKMEKWDLAATAWQKARLIASGPSSREASWRGKRARLMTQLQKKPGDALLLVGLGEATREGGQFEEALQWFRQAVEANPAELRAWWGYGLSLQDSGQVPESLRVWQKLLELPLSEDWQAAVTRKCQELQLIQQLSETEKPERMAELAGMYYASQDWGKALAWIDKALMAEKRPNWFRARAQCLEKLSRWEEAAEAWRTYTAVETEENALKDGVARWVECVQQRIKDLKSQGKLTPCLDLIEAVSQNPDFPRELCQSLRSEVLQSLLAFEDRFALGNVDVAWNREGGSWVINRAQLEGADGRLWTQKKFSGPVRISVQMAADAQYPGKPGLALCTDPKESPTSGCWFAFGDLKEPARLYRPGKTFQDVPDLMATPGQVFTLEMEVKENRVTVSQDGQELVKLDGPSAWFDLNKPFSVGLLAEDGLVIFKDLKIYSLEASK